MKIKNLMAISLAALTLSTPVQAANHTVVKGDTYWTISRQYGVDFKTLLQANGANESSWLEIGDIVYVPTEKVHVVSKGDTYWLIAKWYGVDFKTLLKANNATESSWLEIGDRVIIPQGSSSSGSTGSSGSASTKPYVTYTTYTVKSGDTYWNIANNFGIPMEELLNTNGLTENSSIYAGKTLKIPVHHVPVTSTPGSQYGEYLDWWEAAQYVIPVGATFTVQDFYTGQSFKAKRTTGSGHADCEPLTASDTSKMNTIFGGQNWTSRPVIIIYNGRKIAASATSKLHAGNDGAAGGVWTSWRSDDYGAGYNFDWVKGNNAHGVFDIHFLNSIRHNDGKVHQTHQKNVRTSAGK
ncbi:MAG: LysM peptidoglycan-binding domain-containing protein [Clostridia bacterium]|nr:LysM peptidoglycan-binding domain-containing protein [Clostridia bacterium]